MHQNYNSNNNNNNNDNNNSSNIATKGKLDNEIMIKILYGTICRCKQGGLNEKEIQLNLCNIFSILLFNKFYLFAPYEF